MTVAVGDELVELVGEEPLDRLGAEGAVELRCERARRRVRRGAV